MSVPVKASVARYPIVVNSICDTTVRRVSRAPSNRFNEGGVVFGNETPNEASYRVGAISKDMKIVGTTPRGEAGDQLNSHADSPKLSCVVCVST